MKSSKATTIAMVISIGVIMATPTSAFFFTSPFRSHHSHGTHGVSLFDDHDAFFTAPFGLRAPSLSSIWQHHQQQRHHQLYQRQRQQLAHHRHQQLLLQQQQERQRQEKEAAVAAAATAAMVQRESQSEDNESCRIMISSHPLLGDITNYRIQLLPSSHHNGGHILRVREQFTNAYGWFSSRHSSLLFGRDYSLTSSHECAQRLNDATYDIDDHTGLLTITLPKLPSSVASSSSTPSTTHTTPTKEQSMTDSAESPTPSSSSTTTTPSSTSSNGVHNNEPIMVVPASLHCSNAASSSVESSREPKVQACGCAAATQQSNNDNNDHRHVTNTETNTATATAIATPSSVPNSEASKATSSVISSTGVHYHHTDDDDIEVSNERHIEETPEKSWDASRGYMDLTGVFRPY